MSKQDDEDEAKGCLGAAIMITATIGSAVQFERWGLSGLLGIAAGIVASLVAFAFISVLFSVGKSR